MGDTIYRGISRQESVITSHRNRHFRFLLKFVSLFVKTGNTCFLYIYIPCLERVGGDKLFSGFDLVAH